jgi:hypothetical protein
MFQKGMVYKDVLLIGGENQPTKDDFNKVFPDIRVMPG